MSQITISFEDEVFREKIIVSVGSLSQSVKEPKPRTTVTIELVQVTNSDHKILE